jgi:hypothetical protein
MTLTLFLPLLAHLTMQPPVRLASEALKKRRGPRAQCVLCSRTCVGLWRHSNCRHTLERAICDSAAIATCTILIANQSSSSLIAVCRRQEKDARSNGSSGKKAYLSAQRSNSPWEATALRFSDNSTSAASQKGVSHVICRKHVTPRTRTKALFGFMHCSIKLLQGSD